MITDKFFINSKCSVREAMRKMGEAGEKILLVVDKQNKLLGSLTDGDIRRWILAEGRLSDKIDKIYNEKPVFVAEGYNKNTVKELMIKNKIEWIPVLNKNKEIVDLLLWDTVFGEQITVPKKKIDIPVVIMAGGKGTRLDPFTKILPKPLIPIGDKPIIGIIMDKLSLYGISKFYISINHKSRMIKSYFEEANTGYTIYYIEEEEPLGTAGSLKFLLGKVKGPLLVTNCDIIVNTDYSEIVEFHVKNNHDITIVGAFRHHVIPYGICEIENGGLLTGIKEKPEYDFLVNTGMYILQDSTLDLIPDGQMFHITDLISILRNSGGKVGVFPVNEKSWIDIGQWEEYRRAIRQFDVE